AEVLMGVAPRSNGARWWSRPVRAAVGKVTTRLDPRTATGLLDDALPRDRVVVVEGGSCVGWPCTYLGVHHPDDFVFAMDFRGIGVATGMGVGAAVAGPGRQVVACMGDGGFMMGIADLDTAVRYRLPIVFVVYDDHSLGIEELSLRSAGADPAPAVYDDG